VPPGYEADAFLAIHADGGEPAEHGFKVSAPWRASEASRLLRDALERAYGDLSGLPVDRYGVTYNMRGYYSFSWFRFDHAVAPSTPCAIIETGFLTSAADREVIVDDPLKAARAITIGVLSYLGKRAPLGPRSLVARRYAPMIVETDGARLRVFPSETERVTAVLPVGTVIRPMNIESGWVECVVWGNFRVFGWMRQADLESIAGG